MNQSIKDAFARFKQHVEAIIPKKLPNPHKLTFTGAVTAEYDGSEAVEVNIPEGGSGGIPIDTAEVGQTIVVKAVDENGKPTEWEAADLPSGGGGAEAGWELLTDMTTTEDTLRISITNCDDGTPIVEKKLCAIYVDMVIEPNASLTSDTSLAYNINNWSTQGGYGELASSLSPSRRVSQVLCLLVGSKAMYIAMLNGTGTAIQRATNAGKNPYITGFTVWNSSKNIPTGSNIKIYGVRL